LRTPQKHGLMRTGDISPSYSRNLSEEKLWHRPYRRQFHIRAGRKRRVQERVLPPRGPAFSESVPQPSSYMRMWEWCEVKINLPGASQMATEKLIQRYFVRNKSRADAASLMATAVAWSICSRIGGDYGSLHYQLQRNGSRDV
jgi:hypothetical protein